MKQTFKADSYKIDGPRESDGSYVIKFRTGQHQVINVAKLFAIPTQTELTITVEYGKGSI